MLTRKDQEKKGTVLPDSWKDKVRDLLLSVYGEKAESEGKTFDIHGFTYPDEVVVTVSYMDAQHEGVTPLTYHVSADLTKDMKSEKLLETIIDSIGVFFDHYFNDPENLEYYSRWQEADFKNQKLFYRVTRENVGLTLQANELLGEDGNLD